MPAKILVIRGGAIGDFILTLPAIRLIREAFPTAHLEILGYKHILTLAHERYYADETRSIEYAALARCFARNAELDPDLVEYFRGFNQVISYLFDPDKIFETQLTTAGVKNFLSGSPKISDETHAAIQLARPLEQLALFLEDPAAKFFPSKNDQTEAARWFRNSRKHFAIHLGSGSGMKNWPLRNWIEFADWLETAFDAELLIVGGEADHEQLAAFPRSPRRQILESLPLPELGAVFARVDGFFGHDSGISHLAAAAGARCLLLFGPTDPAIWAPRNADVQVLRSSLPELEPTEVKQAATKIFGEG